MTKEKNKIPNKVKKSNKITCVEFSYFKLMKLYLLILLVKKYNIKNIPTLYQMGNFWIKYPSQKTNIDEKMIDL